MVIILSIYILFLTLNSEEISKIILAMLLATHNHMKWQIV